MLYYDRIDISRGVDLTKSNSSKECVICHYWFFNHGFKFQGSICNDCHYWFFNHGFKFQGSICNDCHYLKMLIVNISDIAIITVRNVDCRCIIQ